MGSTHESIHLSTAGVEVGVHGTTVKALRPLA